MARLSSQPIIKRIIKEFGNKFKITKESKNKFYFDGAYYSPDLVFWNKKNNKIVAIVEIEQGTRKHVVGGAITADYICRQIRPKPTFIILGLKLQDVKDYKKRKQLIIYYAKNFRRVVIGNLKEVRKELKRGL